MLEYYRVPSLGRVYQGWWNPETGYEIVLGPIINNNRSTRYVEVHRRRTTDRSAPITTTPYEALFEIDVPSGFADRWRDDHASVEAVVAAAGMPADIILELFVVLFHAKLRADFVSSRLYLDGLWKRHVI